MLKESSSVLLNKLAITFRILAENALNLIGCLNITSFFSSDNCDKKKIAFQAYSVHLAQFYQTIISELLKEQDKFQITFIVLPHPYYSFQSTLKLRQFVHSELHIPRENIKFYWETIWDKFDLMICTDAYAKFPLRKTKKYLLKHGAGVLYRIIKNKDMHNKTIFDFDLTLLTGDYDFQVIKNLCSNKEILSRLVPVGLPFLDRFEYPGITKEMYFKRLSLDINRKTVLIAPSWRGLRFTAADNEDQEDYFERLIPILREFDVNIIIKLHVCSFNEIMAGGIKWQKEMEKFSDNSDIRIDYDIDDVPALKYSDVLIINTSSSRAYNFMLLDKPVILYPYTENAGDPLDKERIQLMRQGAFVAEYPSDIKDIFKLLREDQTAMSRERVRVAEHCFANHGKATEAVVRLIKQEVSD